MITKKDKNADRRIRHERVREKVFGTESTYPVTVISLPEYLFRFLNDASVVIPKIKLPRKKKPGTTAKIHTFLLYTHLCTIQKLIGSKTKAAAKNTAAPLYRKISQNVPAIYESIAHPR